MLQHEDCQNHHPNHIGAIASTHFIAWMRSLHNRLSQEKSRMINIKLQHRGTDKQRQICDMPGSGDSYAVRHGMI